MNAVCINSGGVFGNISTIFENTANVLRSESVLIGFIFDW